MPPPVPIGPNVSNQSQALLVLTQSATGGGNSSKQLPKWRSSARVRMYACPSGNEKKIR